MFIAMKNFLDNTDNIWNQAISFVGNKNAFDDLINSIYPLVMLRESDITGMSNNNGFTAINDLEEKMSMTGYVLEKLDSLAEMFYQENPEFVNQYHKARMIADYERIGTSVKTESIPSKVA